MGQAVTDGDSLEQELCLKIAENKQKIQTNLMSGSPGNGVRVADRVSHVGANCSSQIRAEAKAGTEAVPSSAQLRGSWAELGSKNGSLNAQTN